MNCETVAPLGCLQAEIKKRKKQKGEILMAVRLMKQLLEAGVHFGHQTRRWNPKMANASSPERNGIHVVTCSKIVKYADQAYDFMRAAANDAVVLFVGTKKQAADADKKKQNVRVGNTSSPLVGWYLLTGGTIKNVSLVWKEIKRMEEEGIFGSS